MYDCPCVGMCLWFQCSRRPEEGFGSSGIITGVCELPNVWEMNSGPLEPGWSHHSSPEKLFLFLFLVWCKRHWEILVGKCCVVVVDSRRPPPYTCSSLPYEPGGHLLTLALLYLMNQEATLRTCSSLPYEPVTITCLQYSSVFQRLDCLYQHERTANLWHTEADCSVSLGKVNYIAGLSSCPPSSPSVKFYFPEL